MKKFCLISIILCAVLVVQFSIQCSNFNVLSGRVIYAQDTSTIENQDIYVVYSEDGSYLFERQNVCLGDEYIDKEMRSYTVIRVDEQTKTAIAKFNKIYDIPKVRQKSDAVLSVAGVNDVRGSIGLYMTHNDESYISGDGYDSIYGAGGIHDIASALKLSLQSKKIDVILDQTLHIPHDSNAYSRSSVTAKNLLKNNVDALFDIHRDGTSRGFYITSVNGKEHCMVRMVVGKANANYAQNKAFALFLASVAKEYAPWLFVDIYMASGHYNQVLSNYALLFEMGCHLVEKDLVLQTVPYLAEVISVALYGELEIVEDEKQENGSDTNDNNSEKEDQAGDNEQDVNVGSGDDNDNVNNNETSNNDSKEDNNFDTNRNEDDNIIIQEGDKNTDDEISAINKNNEKSKDNNFSQGLIAIVCISVLVYAIYTASRDKRDKRQ